MARRRRAFRGARIRYYRARARRRRLRGQRHLVSGGRYGVAFRRGNHFDAFGHNQYGTASGRRIRKRLGTRRGFPSARFGR